MIDLCTIWNLDAFLINIMITFKEQVEKKENVFFSTIDHPFLIFTVPLPLFIKISTDKAA